MLLLTNNNKMYSITIDNVTLNVSKFMTVLQACEKINKTIPYFCYSRSLKVAGNCRMCLVEVLGSLKPMVSCSLPVQNNMVIYTNTALVKKARESVLEFLLINHPLDCPICDQGGECDLQDQSMTFGSDSGRFFETKRSVSDKFFGIFIKTIMTRCIHCTRCVRFTQDFNKKNSLGTIGRGRKTEISAYVENESNILSEFSGNIIDLCPVGALVSKEASFNGRPWDMKTYSTVDLLNNNLSPINLTVLGRKVVKVLPTTTKSLTTNWISNKTRFFFDSLNAQFFNLPLIRNKGSLLHITNEKLFLYICLKIQKSSPFFTNVCFKDLVGYKTTVNLINFCNNLQINSFSHANSSKFTKKSFDFTDQTFLNSKFFNIKKQKKLLFIDLNVQKEMLQMSLELKKQLNFEEKDIYSIGFSNNTIFHENVFSINKTEIIKIMRGRHFVCKHLIGKEPFLIFISSKFMENKTNTKLINVLKAKTKSNVSILNGDLGLSVFNEMIYTKRIRQGIKKQSVNLQLNVSTNSFSKPINNKTTNICFNFPFIKPSLNGNAYIPLASPLSSEEYYLSNTGSIKITPYIGLGEMSKITSSNDIFNLINIFYNKYIKQLSKNTSEIKSFPHIANQKISYTNTPYIFENCNVSTLNLKNEPTLKVIQKSALETNSAQLSKEFRINNNNKKNFS